MRLAVADESSRGLPDLYGNCYLFHQRRMTKFMRLFSVVTILGLLSCQSHSSITEQDSSPQVLIQQEESPGNPDSIRTIHVLVALCDNKYQGIVPVPAGIGNGQNARTNLYWGAGYGIKTYFNKSKEWKPVKEEFSISNAGPKEMILESILFRHVSEPVYLLAEAYNGKFIDTTIGDFLQAAAGNLARQVFFPDNSTLHFAGKANLVAYIGHNGLMDFDMPVPAKAENTLKRELIILACYSKPYFTPHVKATGAKPLLWSTHLMAPEAYILHDGLREWVAKKPDAVIREAAAMAYSKYQRCSKKAAMNLLVTGE